MKKLIIFDFDGVIVDSLKLIEDFDKWLYPSLTDEDWKETTEGNYFEKMIKHETSRINISEEELDMRRKEFYKEKLECLPYSGITETIKELHKNNVLAINTSSKLAGCGLWLEKHGIFDCFDYITTKETAVLKVDKFKFILEKSQIDIENTYFITDTIGDLVEAKSMGIKTICVAWGIHKKEDFLNHNPYIIVNTPHELFDALT